MKSVSDKAVAMHSAHIHFLFSRTVLNQPQPSASFTAKERFLTLKKHVVSAAIQSETHKVEVLECQHIATRAKVKPLCLVEADFLVLFDEPGPGKL